MWGFCQTNTNTWWDSGCWTASNFELIIRILYGLFLLKDPVLKPHWRTINQPHIQLTWVHVCIYSRKCWSDNIYVRHLRAAAGVRGAARGRPGEQQARLIRQGLALSARRVLSLLRDSDIVQTPVNSKKVATVGCLRTSFLLWNSPLYAMLPECTHTSSHLKDIRTEEHHRDIHKTLRDCAKVIGMEQGASPFSLCKKSRFSPVFIIYFFNSPFGL